MRKVRLTIWILLLLLCLSGCDAEDRLPEDTEMSDFASGTGITEPAETAEPTQSMDVPDVTETGPVVTEPTEPEPVAERISEGVKALWGQLDCSNLLCDGSYYTKRGIDSGNPFCVISEIPFGSVYIEWDQIPGEYSITWDGGSVDCGQYGFLHEYISLPETVNSVEIVFPDAESRMICDVQLFTEGTPPADVQLWLPPCEDADILVFPTHSDDDVLFFGPLISYYAVERKLKVQTAFMVDHSWQWERGHERLYGLWELGVRHYPILGSAPDTGLYDFDFGMMFYASSDIPGWQVEQIRRFRPLVVVGHDLEGEYGNCGHKVNAYYLTQTVIDASDPEKYPESAERYGTWDTPKLYLHLYPENSWYFDVNTPLENDPENRTPFEIAVDAFEHHHSQNKYGFDVRQSDNLPRYDCRPFGLYRSLVGNDSAADIMDHIDPDQWR